MLSTPRCGLGVLGKVGTRLMSLDGEMVVGLWSDLDAPEVRAALAVFHPDGVPIRYLDEADVPVRYKLRRPVGEPVPTNVLHAMEQHPAEPWVVRDRMLNEMGWSPRVCGVLELSIPAFWRVVYG